MKIEEAEKDGCPKYVLHKLERAGISEFSRDSTWGQVAKDADVLYYKAHPEEMTFGKKLKELRLKASIGLRKMSGELDMLASRYSNIERGYEHLGSTFYLGKIIVVLTENLPLEELPLEEVEKLNELYHEPFVMQKMPEFLPILHATRRLQPEEEGYTNGDDYNTRPATSDELISMTEWMSDTAKEHNEKADAYNKENGRI